MHVKTWSPLAAFRPSGKQRRVGKLQATYGAYSVYFSLAHLVLIEKNEEESGTHARDTKGGDWCCCC